MSDFKTRRSFEKAFLTAIPNFDETIMHFEHKRKMYEGCNIKFVLDGKLKTMEVYYSQHYIDLWAGHFKEFFKTGKFDYNQYWIPYNEKNTIKENHLIPRKIPLCSKFGNDFYANSSESSDYGIEIRRIYPDCGYKYIGKNYSI